ncbi:hypothetical protein LCGC14_2618030, partial [marine sediment metagenome]
MNKDYRFTICAEIELSDEFTHDLACETAQIITKACGGIVITCHMITDEAPHLAWMDMGFPSKYRQLKAKKMLRRRGRGKPKFKFAYGPDLVTFKTTSGGCLEKRTLG